MSAVCEVTIYSGNGSQVIAFNFDERDESACFAYDEKLTPD